MEKTGGEESRELEASLAGVRRTCQYIKYTCFVCFAAFTVVWCALLAYLALSSASAPLGAAGLREMLYVLAYGLVLSALLLTAARTFADVAGGMSPFTQKQVTRLRLAALLLVALAAVDAALSAGFSYSFAFAGIDFRALGNQGMEQPQININIMALIGAAVFYGVSVLFRYGMLLQRLTDETE